MKMQINKQGGTKKSVRESLEVLTNAALLTVCLTFLALVARTFVFSPSRSQHGGGLHVNETVQRIQGIDFAGAPRTLLLALSSECDFCSSSIDFYNKLIKTPDSVARKVNIVAVFPQRDEIVKKYLIEKQMLVTAVAGVDLSALRVNGTPSIILVDKTGRILEVWTGKLSAESERSLLNSLGT